MKIVYYDKTRLVLEDEKERYEFLNLYTLGYELDINSNYWRLHSYTKKVRDIDLKLDIIMTFHHNGKNAEMIFGYDINHISRRTIKFNEEGNLIRDFIYIFNPLNPLHHNEYDTLVLPNMPMDDYLEECPLDKQRVYKNKYYKESFRNNQLPDTIIYDYLEKDELYSNLLNALSDNPEKIQELANRFNDEIYLEMLEYETNEVKRVSLH